MSKPGSATIQHVMLEQRVSRDVRAVQVAHNGIGNPQMAEHNLRNSANALQKYEEQYTRTPQTYADAERRARL
jgi:hypothetical protein